MTVDPAPAFALWYPATVVGIGRDLKRRASSKAIPAASGPSEPFNAAGPAVAGIVIRRSIRPLSGHRDRAATVQQECRQAALAVRPRGSVRRGR